MFRESSSRLRRLLGLALLPFVTGCILTIDAVAVEGLFSDPLALRAVPRDRVTGTVHPKVRVQFTCNPFLDPDPASRIGVSLRITDRDGKDTGVSDTALLPDGTYTLFATASIARCALGEEPTARRSPGYAFTVRRAATRPRRRRTP